MRPKISVVGAGHVGATTAQRIVEKELGDVVLVDVVEGMPQGKALDIMESAPVEGFDAMITGSNNYADIKDSDLVVITAGLARKPGMTRDDLLLKNAEIVGGVADSIKQYAPNSIVIVVTNPLDVMVYLTWAKVGFPTHRVVGMAGMLDSARFRAFIAMELGVSMKGVEAMVLGGHGDDMVPLARYSTVSGIAIEALLPKEKIEAMITRTRNGGVEIVNLHKAGSAWYGPSSAITAMVSSILRDEKRVLPCCCWCTGEYGVRDMFVGVPARLGRNGVEQIIELDLTDGELAALAKSADHVRENVKKLKL